MSTSKKVFKGIGILLIVIVVAAVIYLNSLLDIITGYASKNLASAVFVSERTQEDMEATDLNFSFIAKAKNSVDLENKSVTSRFLWGKSTAVYRERFGVTLLRDVAREDIIKVSFPEGVLPGYSGDTIQWPMGDIIPDSVTGINIEKLEAITSSLITDNGYGGNAYAFMVLHKGIPVAESYKKRFDSDTRFLSWSMAKSVTNGLLGVLTLKADLNINREVELEDWADDNRNKITLNNLMQMQSGLRWNENYGNRSDVTVMLHEAFDFGKFAYNQPLDYDPGTHWYYSSGTSNIVSDIIRGMFNSDDDYYSFPFKDFFYRIGITDAIFETDPSGTFVGSSYLYMTARDYARFALLYMQDGEFCGKRILPEGWVEYTVEEASASEGEYGSFFWLNKGGELPSAPENMYMCIGHDGQRIFLLPSQELAIIVLGYSPDDSMDFDRLVKDIVETTTPF